MRAISELAPAADTIRRREFRAQGFEEAQIDIQADGNDAVLDIRNGGLRGARHLAKLFLAELLSHPSGTKDGPGLAQASNRMWCRIHHLAKIAHRLYLVNIAPGLLI